MKEKKCKKSKRSIYMTENSWEALRKFAPTVGYRRTAELIADTALIVMKYEDLHWIYDQGELLKKNPENMKLKAALYLIVNDVIGQLKNQGIDISNVMQEAIQNINIEQLGDKEKNE